MRNNLFRAVALGIAGAVSFGASAAFAGGPSTPGCQAKLEADAAKFQTVLTGALQTCANLIQGSISSGKPMSKATLGCEKSLAAAYGKTVTAYRTAVEALVPGVCGNQELLNIGHLLSGGGPKASAPGATAIKFAEDYLLITGEAAAIQAVTNQTGSFLNLISQGQAVGDGLTPCPNLTTPNLCGLKVECKTRGCVLGAGTAATLTTAGLGPVPLTLNGSEMFEMCSITGPLASGMTSGIIYITGSPNRSLGPVAIGAGGINAVCVDAVRGQGWCDCTGHGLPIDATFCQDRLLTHAGTCLKGGAPCHTVTQATDCPKNTCVLPATDDCGSPRLASSPDPNYPGTKAGLPANSPSGASVAGDCFDQSTVQFTLVAFGDEGLDLLPCTADDLSVPSAPVPIPLTTGSAVANMLKAVTTVGTCQDTITACVEDINCVLVPGTPVCSGVVTGTMNVTTGTGSGLTCQSYERGELSGLKMVGAFPAGGGAGTLGDSTTSLVIHCQ